MAIKPKDSQITAQKAFSWFKESRHAFAKARRETDRDAQYYDPGGQWTPSERKTLEERKQPALESNRIKPVLDLVLGTETRSRVDYKAKPRTGQHVEDANIVTHLMKHVMDQNEGEYQCSDAFEDQSKVGFGWVEVCKGTDPLKDPVQIKWEDRHFIHWDPHAKEYDRNDGKYLIREKWMDEEDAIAFMPEFKEAFKQATLKDRDHEGFEMPYEQTGDDIDPHGSVFDWEEKPIRESDWIDKDRKRLRLLEVQYKVPVKVMFLEDQATGEVEEFEPQNPIHVQKLTLFLMGQDPNLSIENKTIRKVRVAIIAGPNVLQDKWSIYRHNRWTLVPFWGFLKDKTREPYGLIRERRDPQDEVNKRRSKALHILNTRRIEADDDAVDDWEELRQEAARPDGILKGKKGRKLELHNDINLAEAQVLLMQEAKEEINFGIPLELMGHETQAKSGKAIGLRQSQGNTILAPLFDNYRRSRQLVGELMWSCIQQFYTKPRVIRVIDREAPEGFKFITINEKVTLGDKPYIQNDISRAKVDIEIDEQAFHATIREAILEQMMDLAVKLPPEISLSLLDLIVGYSDVPGKDEMVRRIQQIQSTLMAGVTAAPEPGTATA